MPPKRIDKENVDLMNEKSLEEHTVVELRQMLGKMQLETSGKKSVLIERIQERYEKKHRLFFIFIF